MIQIMLSGALAMACCCVLPAEDKKAEKIDPAKVIGTWEWTDTSGGTTTFEFTKHGQSIARWRESGKEYRFTCVYTVDGNKMVQSFAGCERLSVTRTITKLTDAALVLTDTDGKEMVFVRPKGK